MSRVLGETVAPPALRQHPPTGRGLRHADAASRTPSALGTRCPRPGSRWGPGARWHRSSPCVAGLAATIPLARADPRLLHPARRGPRRRAGDLGRGPHPARRVTRRQARGSVLGTVAAVLVVASVSGWSASSCPTTTRPTGCACARRGSDDRRRSAAADTVVPPVTGRQRAVPGHRRADSAPAALRRPRPVRRRGVGAGGRVARSRPGGHLPAARARDRRRCTPAPRSPSGCGSAPATPATGCPCSVSSPASTSTTPTAVRSSRTSATTRRPRARSCVGGVDPRDDYTFTSVLTPDDFRPDDETMPPDRRAAPARGRLPRPVPRALRPGRSRAARNGSC